MAKPKRTNRGYNLSTLEGAVAYLENLSLMDNSPYSTAMNTVLDAVQDGLWEQSRQSPIPMILNKLHRSEWSGKYQCSVSCPNCSRDIIALSVNTPDDVVDSLRYCIQARHIQFCPSCGKKLSEPEWSAE